MTAVRDVLKGSPIRLHFDEIVSRVEALGIASYDTRAAVRTALRRLTQSGEVLEAESQGEDRLPAHEGPFIASMFVEYENEYRLRAFADEPAARRHVEGLAVKLVRLKDAGKTQLFLAHATVYAITPSGRARAVASFDGYDRGDGFWHGWE
jgi:hypothetical protein